MLGCRSPARPALPPVPQVVPLAGRERLLPGAYPRFTMLGQAAGSVAVAWQGLRQLVPELWVDTTGWAFPYPLARLAGSRVAAYVHYPTISSDMLQRCVCVGWLCGVWGCGDVYGGLHAWATLDLCAGPLYPWSRHGRRSSPESLTPACPAARSAWRRVWDRDTLYNNVEDVAGSPLRSLAKLAYYHAFALLYGLVGAFAQVRGGGSGGSGRLQSKGRRLGVLPMLAQLHPARAAAAWAPHPCHACHPPPQVVMVNSSWTRRHIAELWWQWHKPQRVYPPCDTRALQALPLDRRLKRLYLISVAQFRWAHSVQGGAGGRGRGACSHMQPDEHSHVVHT